MSPLLDRTRHTRFVVVNDAVDPALAPIRT